MHPLLIAGAALVGLPIILHLIMKQEPKRLPFPAFRFLKDRLKTNQRKLRLRHFLLLALRMLLIALFCLTLYQPSALSEGFGLTGDQPVAVVIVVDTSPSMGYASGDKSRLDEARRRALELLDTLPEGSRVAVVDTTDLSGNWLPSASDARRRLGELKEPKGTGQPVTSAVGVAYQLLRTVDDETESTEPMPRLVAVFTDRAASSWDPARVEDLRKLREAIPDPKPAHAVVDVGVDQPANVAILSAEMRPQVLPANQPAVVTVTVAAVGPDVEAVVKAQLGDLAPHRKPVTVPGGQTRSVAFEFKDLKVGLHQVRFELETKDALLADNTRFLTSRTAEARRVLTVASDPDAAGYWKLALDARGEFAAEVVTPEQAQGLDPGKYEAVVLFGLARPDAGLWGKVEAYCAAGGKLVVVPGGELSLEDYNGEAATRVLPGVFKRLVDTTEAFPDPKDPKARNRHGGVTWSIFTDADDRLLQHPMLAPFKGWRQQGNVDFIRYPRKVRKFWEVEPRGEGQAVVHYDTDDDPKARAPAVLERNVLDAKTKAPKGKVILLTTWLGTDADQGWNDYWEGQNSWAVVFPDLVLRYAAGGTEDANFNHPTGQAVTVPLAKLLDGKRENVVIDGPGIGPSDAVIRPTDRQTEVRIGPPRTNSPGNFVLTGPNPDWREGFSLNVPAEESTLDKVPAEAVEELTGAGTVVPVGKDLTLADALEGTGTFKHPVDLFPWLLIAVLMLLVLEAFVANRFYRRPK